MESNNSEVKVEFKPQDSITTNGIINGGGFSVDGQNGISYSGPLNRVVIKNGLIVEAS
jgi:hypothetical protein